MAIDSVFSVSTTGSQVNSTQKSAEDRVEKQVNDNDKSKASNAGASSEVNPATPTVNTGGQKIGTTINTMA